MLDDPKDALPQTRPSDFLCRRREPATIVVEEGPRRHELTDSSVSESTEADSPDELPALAFCLLFRFQGAEAQARPTGDPLWLGAGWLFRGRKASVERKETLTLRHQPHNLPPKNFSCDPQHTP
jgi:hypothetical protein